MTMCENKDRVQCDLYIYQFTKRVLTETIVTKLTLML